MAEDLRNLEEEAELSSLSEKTTTGGDLVAFQIFNTRLFEYLSIVESCPQEILDVIIKILDSKRVLCSVPYGALLQELSVSGFLFTVEQSSRLADTILKNYHLQTIAMNRMLALIAALTFLGPTNSSLRFLSLYEDALKRNLPQAELVWELLALSRDNSIPPQNREIIVKSIPRK